MSAGGSFLATFWRHETMTPSQKVRVVLLVDLETGLEKPKSQ